MNKAIKNLIEPEAVFRLAELVEIVDLAPVQNLAFASKRCDGAQVRMHCGVHQAGVIVVALNVPRPIEPVHAERFHAFLRVIVNMDKFHNPAEVVRLAWRLAYKVDLI